MPVYDLGPANHHAGVCISRIRWLSPLLKEKLQKESLWEDLIQEMYATAFLAWKQGMDNAETRRYAMRCLYAFLKAYGFRRYRGVYYKFERTLSIYNLDIGIPDKDVTPHRFSFDTDHFEEKIVDYLKKHPEGLSRRMFCARFQIPVWEVSSYMSRLIREGVAVEIKRENTRGRPLTPLLVALEPGQVLPKPEMVKIAQTERIRHAYFAERKSIKQVAREFHHDRRTVRRAIHESKLEAVASSLERGPEFKGLLKKGRVKANRTQASALRKAFQEGFSTSPQSPAPFLCLREESSVDREV